MDITERQKFYEKVYFHELDQREKIYAKPNLLVLSLTSMAAINAVLIVIIFDLGSEASLMSIVLGIFSVLILICLLYCIYRALTGWVYHKIPLKGFEKHHNEMIEYYKEYYSEDHNEQKLELMAKETFQENLTQQLMVCADHNSKINQKRNTYIIWFTQILLLYLAVLASLYVSLLIDT